MLPAIAPARLPHFSREFEILLACAAHEGSPRANSFARLFGDEVDGDVLLRGAEHHRLIPQLYHSVHSLSCLPEPFFSTLRRRYAENARQTLRLSRDLVQVAKKLESRQISFLAYKGPTLAAALHREVTERQFADIDVLVPASLVEDAQAALVELGYASKSLIHAIREKSYMRSGYELAFDLPDAPNVLELKWNILPRFYTVHFDLAELFARSKVISVADHPLPTLSVEDLFLVLCVHAAKHSWSELSLVRDVAQLINAQPLNWDTVREQARKLGIQRIVYINLTLARNLLGAEIPTSTQKEFEMERPSADTLFRVLSVASAGQQVNTESISYFRSILILRERWRDRGRFLWRLIFSSSTRQTIALPAWLSPLYFVIRMYRLAGRLKNFVLIRAGVLTDAK